MRKIPLLALSLSLLLPWSAFSETIAQKKAALSPKKEEGSQDADSLLPNVNAKLSLLRTQLKSSYEKARQMAAEEASEEQYKQILEQVNGIKSQITQIETKWREAVVAEGKREEEGYALWDQEETTLANLVMEYGSMEYLYIVTPDMANLKLNMHSNLPIPRESWNEMLEIILMHNGIGVKKVNSYARQLYILKQDPSAVQAIASQATDLALIDNQTRIFYVFSPPPEQIKSSFQFFEKFADAKQTFVYQIGAKIAFVATKDEVEKLLMLYNAVWEDSKGKICKVVPVTKMSVKEMEKILQSFFGEAMEKNRPPFAKNDQEGLTILSLAQGNAVILIGQQGVVDRAETIVKETEEQLQDPAEMTVYMYTCQHSDPTDLAHVLEKVYASLLTIPQEGQREMTDISYSSQGPMFRTPDGYAPTPPLVVSPPPLKPGNSSQIEVDEGTDHFIPDPKTGNLLMVVRRDALAKIKELLHKLDVPKKMVQIEVLLFEKRISNQNDFGLDLLKIGTHRNGVNYHSNIAPNPKHRGVLEFVFKQARHGHMPALNLAYTFLMTQEDVQLNAAPSVITVNQTPATISIVEEISINNGAAPVDTNKGIAFEKSFTRAQYGIILVMTPTLHTPDEVGEEKNSDGKGFVTLKTNITFDTTKSHHDDRPMVDRRHIENEVRVVDGETIILGGLRRKSSHDQFEKIPFFGEIPGIGKFFGSSKLSDSTTEMIFFITPKIVPDPKEELIQMRTDELKKRPGDIPEFLDKLVEAQNKERRKWFQNSMKLFFGRGNDQ